MIKASPPGLALALLAATVIGCGQREPSVATKDAGDGTGAADGSASDADAGGLPDGGGAGNDAGSGNDGGPGASPCGVCPSGYTCGSANGTPVCRAPSGVPLFSHVFVIVMENTSLATLQKATNTPYLLFLQSSAAWHASYHGVAHPSLPNYIALTSGDIGSIGCDCHPTGNTCDIFNCNALLSGCGCPQNLRHIGDDLDAAGISWRSYNEDMVTPCNTVSGGTYAARHVPFLYYPSVQARPARCNDRVVDFSVFKADLAAAPRRFNLIAPNLIHDMHDPFPAGATNLANGDAWLEQTLTAITASGAYKSGGLVLVAWDEDDLSGTLAPDDPVPLFVLSPLAKRSGFNSSSRADHYSLLATVEDGLAIPRLGKAAGATPLSEFFPAQ